MRRPRNDTIRVVLLGVVVGCAVSTMILVSVGVFVLLQNSRAATAQRDAQLSLARLLVECTTPPESRKPPVKLAPTADDCYQRALRQQAWPRRASGP